jgi:hypothetical protein
MIVAEKRQPGVWLIKLAPAFFMTNTNTMQSIHVAVVRTVVLY